MNPLDNPSVVPHIPRPMSLFINLLLAINIVVSLLIIFVVLMQRPKSEGLGAAFGGGMTENLFGAQTSNVLANFTRWLGAIFFSLTLILSILYAKQSTQRSSIQARLLQSAAAAAALKPVTNPAATTTGTAAAMPAAASTSGTETSGTSEPFGETHVNLAAPASAASPGSLLPSTTVSATPVPAPAASPVSSGSSRPQ